MIAIAPEILETAAKRPENLDTWRNLAAEARAAGMGQRDSRDLLMEFGCDGITAGELVA
jgi:hypothetical protein